MKHERRIKIIVLLSIIIMLAILPIVASGEVPQQINYQGYVTDLSADPLEGDYRMVFSIYDVPTGGTPLWSEEQAVLVINGIYNVRIGQDPIGNPFPFNLFEGERWLGVSVGADTEMTPRQILTSTPFAMRAEVADRVADGTVATVHIVDSAITGAKIEDGTIAAVELQDGATLSEILDDDGAGSGLDADTLDGMDSGAFLSTTSDFGRLGVAGDLYEGTQTLSTRYINSAGPDIISGSSSATMLQALNTGSGAGLRGSSQSEHGTIGYSDATDKAGVFGNSPDGYGVWGNSVNSHAVFGQSTGGHGVRGVSAAGGVFGESTQGVGVEGKSNTNDGVVGVTLASDKSGVFGRSDTGNGVTGRSGAASGVLGVTTSSDPDDAGVRARNEGGGPAIRSDGDLYVSGKSYGNVGPSEGAPFPRPAFDSGWVAVTPPHIFTLGVGSVLPTSQYNNDNFVIDMMTKVEGFAGNRYVGDDGGGSWWDGTFYRIQNNNDITVGYDEYDDGAQISHVRIRIWYIR